MLQRLHALATILVLLAGTAKAHELSPAIADLSFAPGSFTIAIAVNLEVLVARIEPGNADTNDSANAADYDRLRALPPEAMEQAFAAFTKDFLDGVSVSLDGMEQEVAEIGRAHV